MACGPSAVSCSRTAAIVVSLLVTGGSFLAVGTPMRDSLQFPTRGELKRPHPPRPDGIGGKFPDIKLHGRSGRAKHEEITSKSAWWVVIRVCGLTMIFAGATVSPSAPPTKFPMKNQRDSEKRASARALTRRKGALGDNYRIEEKSQKRRQNGFIARHAFFKTRWGEIQNGSHPYGRFWKAGYTLGEFEKYA